MGTQDFYAKSTVFFPNVAEIDTHSSNSTRRKSRKSGKPSGKSPASLDTGHGAVAAAAAAAAAAAMVDRLHDTSKDMHRAQLKVGTLLRAAIHKLQARRAQDPR